MALIRSISPIATQISDIDAFEKIAEEITGPKIPEKLSSENLQRAIDIIQKKIQGNIRRQVVGRLKNFPLEVKTRARKKSQFHIPVSHDGLPLNEAFQNQNIILPEFRNEKGLILPEIAHAFLLALASYYLPSTQDSPPFSYDDENSRKIAMNAGRLSGIVAPKKYQTLWTRGAEQKGEYRFMFENINDQFIEIILNFLKLDNLNLNLREINGLELGGGTGRHAMKLIEKGIQSITLVDISDVAIERAKKNIEKAFPDQPIVKKRLYTPEATDMKDFLHSDEGQYGLIYFHSATHYYDDPRFQELMELANNRLLPGGYIVIVVKLPHTTLDQEGISLIDSRITMDGREYIANSGSICIDGIVRYFRDVPVLRDLVIEKTNLKSIQECTFTIPDYEFDKQGPQSFTCLVLKKMEK